MSSGFSYKPTKVDEFTLPPEDDSRFSTAPQYPKEYLNESASKRDKNKDPLGGQGGFKGSPRFNGGMGPQ